MVVMLSLLAFGVLFFQVGRAAIFSTEAQTAADAAALGAVQEIKAQLIAQVATTGTSDLALIDPARVRAAAERARARTRATSSSSSGAAWTSRCGRDDADARARRRGHRRGGRARHGAGPRADRRARAPAPAPAAGTSAPTAARV